MYFKNIIEKLERQANCRRAQRDITFSQGKILWYLHRCEDEPVTLRDIERFFDCSHATVSGIVNRLVEKGHVYLETNENDRRAKNVRLTEKEKITFRQIQCEHRQTEEMLLKGFSNEEKEKFSEYLERVYKNLE